MTWYQLPELPVDQPQVPRPGVVPQVWPTGQHREHLTEHGYTPATARDHLRVAPATAAYAIRAFTRPGGTVIDPDCGAGTVVVEAVHCGRHAVGVAHGRRWWALARANLTAATHQGATADGMVLSTSRTDDLTGSADLVLTAWRHPADTAAYDAPGGDSHAGDRLAEMLTWSRGVLKPGGHLIVVARPQRRHGYLLDAPGHLQHAAQDAHLALVGRCIALHVPLRDGRLLLQPTWAQHRALARAERLTGHPIALTAHHDVLVFRAPQSAQAATAALPAATPIARRLQARADAGLREPVGDAA